VRAAGHQTLAPPYRRMPRWKQRPKPPPTDARLSRYALERASKVAATSRPSSTGAPCRSVAFRSTAAEPTRPTLVDLSRDASTPARRAAGTSWLSWTGVRYCSAAFSWMAGPRMPRTHARPSKYAPG